MKKSGQMILVEFVAVEDNIQKYVQVIYTAIAFLCSKSQQDHATSNIESCCIVSNSPRIPWIVQELHYMSKGLGMGQNSRKFSLSHGNNDVV